jgi:hypothetical protein
MNNKPDSHYDNQFNIVKKENNKINYLIKNTNYELKILLVYIFMFVIISLITGV